MKYLKLIWLVSVVAFSAYFVIEWLKSGFDSNLIATGVVLLASGIGLLNKK